MGSLAVDLDLGGDGKAHPVVALAEGADLLVPARLLVAELVAREPDHGKAALPVGPVQLFQSLVLRGQTALARRVDDQ